MSFFILKDFDDQKIPLSHSVASGKDIIDTLSLESAKDIIAVYHEGKYKDLSTPLAGGGSVKFVFKDTPEGIEILRHSAAHVLAHAVKELFPDTQVTIGPVIENGFYYDFFRKDPFKEEDLLRIQQRMKEIVQRNIPIVRQTKERSEAISFFKEMGEDFKARIIEDLPQTEELSLYEQGNFIDLCRGPHIPSTGSLGMHFALTKTSGAYWRADAKNPQLQRIYGTAFACEKQLSDYLTALEEAKTADHRKLGKEMDLFHFQEEAPGSVFWHPKGWTLYQLLQKYIREKLQPEGYQEINTPQLVSKVLWERSGHWDKFRQNMFCVDHIDALYALKPMSCPCHIQVFNQGQKSYRDLPLRFAEYGSCMRDEPSGALSGLMRVRSFVQDDGHIFCTPDQLIVETQKFCHLLLTVYKELGFEDVLVRFSSRPDQRLGSDALWDKAEESLCKGADAAGLSYIHFPKEGAFYGPKLEFVLKDKQQRLWQCGTLQADFVLPERLGAFYVDADGEKRHPVMLHRAILGTFERFIGILLEHYAGRLPFWLSPTQAVVATISEKSIGYAEKLFGLLSEKGFRVICDVRPEKIGYKIREHTSKKTPCLLVVGEKEALADKVCLRIKDKTYDLQMNELISLFERCIKEKTVYPL